MSLYQLERDGDVQELIGVCRRSDKAELRARAAELLGGFPDHDDREDVVNALVAVATADDHDAVTAAAVDSLDRLGGDAIERLIAEAAGVDVDGADWVKARAYVRALDDGVPELRMAAANGLGALGHDDAVPALVDRFDDADPRVRRVAVGAFGNFDNERPVEYLVGALTDDSPAVRRTAVFSLVELLANVPTNKSHEIRETVVEQLSETDDRNVVLPLVEILEESQQNAQRRNTAWLLGRVADEAERERVVDALVAALAADDRMTTQFAATSLAELGGDIVERRLLGVVEDESMPSQARAKAVFALGKVGGEESRRRLDALLDETGDEQVRKRAFSAISKLGGRG